MNPPGVTPITQDQLARFGIDQGGHLYFDGQLIHTTLSLPWWVELAAVAAIVVAVFTAAIFFWLVFCELARWPQHPAWLQWLAKKTGPHD